MPEVKRSVKSLNNICTLNNGFTNLFYLQMNEFSIFCKCCEKFKQKKFYNMDLNFKIKMPLKICDVTFKQFLFRLNCVNKTLKLQKY